jgi:hypothetical protein
MLVLLLMIAVERMGQVLCSVGCFVLMQYRSCVYLSIEKIKY